MKHAAYVALLSICPMVFGVNTAGQRGLARTWSAHTLGMNGLSIGAWGALGVDQAYATGANGGGEIVRNGSSVESGLPMMVSGNVYASYGLLPLGDISVDFPLYYDITGFDERVYGFGDLGVAAKFRLPGQRHDAILLNAYYFRGTFPTGSKDKGFFPRRTFYVDAEEQGNDVFTAGKLTFSPVILWTLDFTRGSRKVPLLLHLNFGGVITEDSKDNAFIGRFAFEIKPNKTVTLFTEAAVESRVRNWLQSYSPENIEQDPAWVSPGVKLHLPANVDILMAGDFGVSSPSDRYRTNWSIEGYRYATAVVPRFGAHMQISWQLPGKRPDADNDGIADSEDQCPNQPEDADGFEDADGCPDNDNDADGVLDAQDSCPNEAAACDGCPVRDQDGDGVLDDNDACPAAAEDADGFEDADGCPDSDNDADGILDTQDACPDEAEDVDGFEDDNGCPDTDNDSDGVTDEWDKCPNRKGHPDADGCPRAKEIKRGRLILKGVHFESGKAALTPNSFAILDQVFRSLREWPEVRIEIRGYTDSIGSATLNQRLSQKRAESVRDYLIQKGVDPSRIRAVGMGEQDPIAPNTVASGRAKNRRVEIHRID